MYVFSCSKYYLCACGTQRKRESCIHMHDLPVWRELVLLQLSGTALALLVPPIYSATLKGTETEGENAQREEVI